MNLPTNYKPEKLAREQMRRFIYEFDIRADGLPKRIEPALVERFLREELAKGRPGPKPANQVAELADFYDARGIVPDLMKHLDKKETGEEAFLTSLALTKAVGILGDDAQREFGRKYYLHLLAFPYVETRLEDLLDVLAVYAPDEQIDATKARVEQVLAVLKERAQTDEAAGMAMRHLENQRNNSLPRVAGAAKVRADILAAAEADRLDRLVAIYLGLDMRYYEYTNRWAVRMLLREARAGKAELVVEAFRRALPKAGDPKAEEDAVAARRALVFHALEFLGANVSPEERKEMKPQAKPFDYLSIEP